ncbi:hypothetical protein FIBSPDRAFT_1045126 [Athelia psychrophila]|uniref:NYN domain-containing protein n=1 Tax=Athelia psychrophila TaxID=1759441 RepID=A0A166IQ38_9AGAM|nr:hypothetical protein FIBSPDRAFT_1045126 [Fibularhizoctonia sp. CBS 109695]
MSEETPVAIFWDIDKLPVPSEFTTYETVHKITDKAHAYGPVTLFRAYSDVPEFVNGGSARFDLLAAGVSFVQVESKSNAISVDMLVYAMDHPTPPTLVVISDDSLLIYACSILRMRKHRIVVISLSNTIHRMQRGAFAFVDWTGLMEAGDDGQEFDPHSAESLGGGSPATIPPAAAPAPAPPASPPAAPPAAPVYAPPLAAPATPAQAQAQAAASSTPKTWASLAAINVKKWGAAVAQESHDTTGVPSSPASSNTPLAPVASFSLGQYRPQANSFPHNINGGSAHPARVAGTFVREANLTSDTSKTPPLTHAHHQQHHYKQEDAGDHVPVTWRIPDDSDVAAPPNVSRPPSSLRATSAAPQDRSLFQGLIDELMQHGSHPDRSVVAVALLARDPSAYTRAGVATFKEFTVKAVAAGVVTLGTSKNGAGKVFNTIYLTPVWEHPSTGLPVRSTLVTQSSSPELPPAIRFKSLIEVLQQKKGDPCLSHFHAIMRLMENDPLAFPKGGPFGESLRRFECYATLAEEAGVVTLSESSGTKWVSLNPAWRPPGASIGIPMSAIAHGKAPPSLSRYVSAAARFEATFGKIPRP